MVRGGGSGPDTQRLAKFKGHAGEGGGWVRRDSGVLRAVAPVGLARQVGIKLRQAAICTQPEHQPVCAGPGHPLPQAGNGLQAGLYEGVYPVGGGGWRGMVQGHHVDGMLAPVVKGARATKVGGAEVAASFGAVAAWEVFVQPCVKAKLCALK